MSAALANAIRAQAQLLADQDQLPTYGLISSYDPNSHTVKVTLQPSGVETNWMPLGAIGVGNGWGLAVGPQIGDQVIVIFPNGEHDNGFIAARVFSNAQRAIPVPSGETWVVHKGGSSLKFMNDGNVTLTTQKNLVATVGANLTATVAGDMSATVTGNATISAAIASIIAATSAAITAPSIMIGAAGQSLMSLVTSTFQALFNLHTHSVPGVAETAPPSQPMPDAALTTTIKGG